MATKQTRTAEEAESARLAKNQKIKETMAATRDRHAQMDIVVRELKIVENKLNTAQKEALNRLFLEAKWLRNAALAAGRFDVRFPPDQKYVVDVKTKDGFEPRELKVCRGMVAKGVMTQLETDRNNLAKKKKRGGKIGKLKFKSEISVVDLQQLGTAYNIDLKWKRIHVSNVKGWLKASGFKTYRRTPSSPTQSWYTEQMDFSCWSPVLYRKTPRLGVKTKTSNLEQRLGLTWE